tara:strand:- start:514 stop:1230 length:717 start_codon:yes stop_codon:yes gene_type:complete
MVYLFDIDGTLTESRTKMTSAFTVTFLEWVKDRTVYLVTGSDLPKVDEQMPKSIYTRVEGVFASMANELYIGNEKIYENKCTIPEHITKWLDDKLRNSGCPDTFKETLHYEYRPGMLNFSVCGRDVTTEQRKNYFDWDNKLGERKDIVSQFNEQFNRAGYEACVGGEISIDIQEIGNNKSQAIKWIAENKNDTITYVGDRCTDGGNDYAACMYIDDNDLGTWHNVHSPDETIQLLSTL